MSVSPTNQNSEPITLFSYRFTPKTPNITSGVEVVLPYPLSVLLGAFVETDTAWDGTTPMADFGFSESGAKTIFTTLGAGAIDLTAAGTSYGGSTEPSQALFTKPLVIVPEKYNTEGFPTSNQTPTALYVAANQTGVPGGASSASTVGSSTLYLMLATPVNLNVSLDQPLR